MKKAIFSLILVLSQIAMAANDSINVVAVALGAYGVSRGTYALAIRSYQAMELKDWRDPETGATSVLTNQCGIVLEGRLIGNIRQNGLFLVVHNQTDDVLTLRPEEIVVRFQNGLERRTDLTLQDHYKMEGNWQYMFVLPFPQKLDFKDQNRLTVSIPVMQKKTPCVIKFDMIRPNVPEDVNTYTRATFMDWEIGYGAMTMFGDLKESTTAGRNGYRMNMRFFGGLRHGFYLGFSGVDRFDLPGDTATRSGYTRAGLNFLDIGYVHRWIISSNLTGHLQAGIGSATLGYYRDENRFDASEGVGTVSVGGVLSHRFSRVDTGAWQGDYSWGLGVQDHFLSSRMIKGDISLQGQALHSYIFVAIGL